ncbi:hypothetical protein BJX96DRAFT_171649 [Aspergillus floccosus]
MQFSIPELFVPDGSRPSDDGGKDLELSGSSQMQWIQKAMMDRGTKGFLQRVPTPEIIVTDAGIDDTRGIALRDRDDRWIMVYSPTGRPFAIDISRLASCRLQGHWYDPLTGEEHVVGYGLCGIKDRVQRFQPPTEDDWVLILEEK